MQRYGNGQNGNGNGNGHSLEIRRRAQKRAQDRLQRLYRLQVARDYRDRAESPTDLGSRVEGHAEMRCHRAKIGS